MIFSGEINVCVIHVGFSGSKWYFLIATYYKIVLPLIYFKNMETADDKSAFSSILIPLQQPKGIEQ